MTHLGKHNTPTSKRSGLSSCTNSVSNLREWYFRQAHTSVACSSGSSFSKAQDTEVSGSLAETKFLMLQSGVFSEGGGLVLSKRLFRALETGKTTTSWIPTTYSQGEIITGNTHKTSGTLKYINHMFTFGRSPMRTR